jgi:hypothetical protein
MSVSDAHVAEGNTGTTQLVFDVTLSAPSTRTITVDYVTADDTATTADNDYVPATKGGVLTFQPGETSRQIAVPVVGDTTIEPDEQFFLNLSSPLGATLARAQAVGTITNDDEATITLTIVDSITVTDTPGVLPSAMLSIADNITVTDTPVVLPSAMLSIADNITVTDTPGVLPSAMLTIADNITVTDTPSVAPEAGTPTPTGTGVLIPGRNAIGQLQPVTVHFSTITQPGVTFVDLLPAPPPLPANFIPFATAMEINTTAVYSGLVTVCFTGSAPPQPRLLHYSLGAWADVTTPTTAGVCGQTTSLSPFVIGSFADVTPPPPPVIDRKRPVVTAPESITIVATGPLGARGSASPTLAVFLVGGSAVDNMDPAPVRLAPMARGSQVTNDTLFPLGKTTVTFSFRDAAGNVGRDTATITVVKPNDKCHGDAGHGHHDGDGCLGDHHGHYPGDNCRGHSADGFHHDGDGDDARDGRHVSFLKKR